MPGGDEDSEQAQDEWADEFVQACLKQGLGAIAITDHRDIVMYPYVERAIERSPEAKNALWLFPGMRSQPAHQHVFLHALAKRRYR
ncbi:MAG: hypothetical protein WBA42_15200 [Mesorhizobium sp.]